MKNKDIIEFNNIKEIIYNSAKIYKDNIAFTIKHQNEKEIEYQDVTYKELLDDINALGTAMYLKGAKNKRVAIIGKNRYEWIVTHLANLLGGIVSIPLDKDLQLEELENSLIRSKADYIVFDEKIVDRIEEIKKNNKTNLKDYICMSNISGYETVPNLINEGKKQIKNNNEYVNFKIKNNDMNILLFT